jgi:hypothetical protein
MYSQTELVTPAHAQVILAHRNPTNRPMSRAHVRKKLKEMAEGRWKLNPQGISFDPLGNLLDGQHTLQAIVELGQAVNLYVHHDVPPDVQDVMDQGLGRTAAQMLATKGVEGSRHFTAAARAVMEHGLRIAAPSNTQVVAWAQVPAHFELLSRYKDLARLYTAGTHAAFVFAELNGWRHIDGASERLQSLEWGENDDPMKALKKALDNMGGRDGAKAKRARFFTTLGTLLAVDRDEPLSFARKYDEMPRRVRESVRPELVAA